MELLWHSKRGDMVNNGSPVTYDDDDVGKTNILVTSHFKRFMFINETYIGYG